MTKPEAGAQSPYTVLFISGEGRSGSTIVSSILGDHTNAVEVGELRNIWVRGVQRDELCGCGRPFSRCEFWQQVGNRAFGGWDKASADKVIRQGGGIARHRHGWLALARKALRLPVSSQTAEWAAYHARVYDAIRAVSGCSVVVDSSKEPAYAAAIVHGGLTDLRVLHLVRDPRAVAFSFTRKKVRHEANGSALSQGAAQLMPRLGGLRASVAWNLRNLQSQALQLFVPYLRQRYEGWSIESIEEREQEVQVALRLSLSGAHERDETGSRLYLAGSHSVSGNPSRFERTHAVEVRPDTAWADVPRTWGRMSVSLLTFPLRVAYGYSRGLGRR